MQEYPLLQTKLYLPRIRPELVSRPRLLEQLDAGLDRKLTLISAPAGFGKTTLVSQWARAIGARAQPVAASWLSLDEGDNDLSRFLAYVVAALRMLPLSVAGGPEAGRQPATAIGQGVLSALRSPGIGDAGTAPATEAVLISLINDLAAIPEPVVLVLDDYHQIEAQAIHDALTFLLRHLPPQAHLVIATRDDPHLPLAGLRARGELIELRAADLRFSSSEAAEFLNQEMGLVLSAGDVAALEARTEGWIAGLQLAALSLQGRRDTSKLIRRFTGSHRFVLDYLVQEVLDLQSDTVKSFLLQTAVLKELTGSLCDAVTHQENGQATLEMLERANLFIVPLDNERRWYRYHHLFADLLRQRSRQTQPEEIPRLHRRASEWYEQQDLPADAIHHALAAQDYNRAMDLAELAWPAWSESYRSIAWLGWLKDLPDALTRSRPVLCMGYAWALLNAGKLEAADTKLRDVEGWLEPPDGTGERRTAAPSEMVVVDDEQFRALPISLANARAYHAQAAGDLRGTAQYVRRALDLLPEDDTYNRAAVTGLLGLAYWAGGDLEAAHRTFSEGLFQNAHDQIKGTFVLADMKMALGQLREAERACERGLQLAREFYDPMPIGTEDVYTAMSELHRERGDLEAAAQDLAAGKQLGDEVELRDWKHRWCIAQAHLKESRGDLDAALNLLDEAERLFVRTPVPDIRPIAAMKARLWVRQGRLAEAQAWASKRDLSPDDALSYRRELEHMTLARMLVAQYKDDRAEETVRQAQGLLKRLLQAADEGRRLGSVIQILVLQALAHEAHGDLASALVPLERALALAEPEGYVQVFVDEGPPMARLLYEALGRGIAADYGRRLLAAFPIVGPEPGAPSKAQDQGSNLLEPLSERELEVLYLIADGLSNRQIASSLYVSLNTVKGHTRNIYGKLGVHSRTQAVARARALGIVPASD